MVNLLNNSKILLKIKVSNYKFNNNSNNDQLIKIIINYLNFSL